MDISNLEQGKIYRVGIGTIDWLFIHKNVQTKGAWIFSSPKVHTYAALRLNDGRLFFESILFSWNEHKYLNEASIPDAVFFSKKLADISLRWNSDLNIFERIEPNPETVYPDYIPFESKVLVRNENLQQWTPAFWGYKQITGEARFTVVGGGTYKQCIPYNDETKHLCGSTADCNWKYKVWTS